MSTGSIIGGILGGVGGSFVGSPQAGYALGSSLGGIIDGGNKWRKANQMQIAPTDPRQTQLLNEIIRKRRALEAGTMYQPQQDAISQQGAYAMNRVARASGGDINATIQALNMINRGTGRNMNELYGQMMGQSMNMMGIQNQLAQMIGAREYQTQAYNKAQAMGDSARILQNSMANLAGYYMRGGSGNAAQSVIQKILGGGNPSTSSGGVGGWSPSLNVNNVLGGGSNGGDDTIQNFLNGISSGRTFFQ